MHHYSRQCQQAHVLKLCMSYKFQHRYDRIGHRERQRQWKENISRDLYANAERLLYEPSYKQYIKHTHIVYQSVIRTSALFKMDTMASQRYSNCKTDELIMIYKPKFA